MTRTKAKREIETILKNSITPRTYEYIQIKTAPKNLPVAIYKAILGVKGESGLKYPLPYARFDDLFSEFQKRSKKDFNGAVLSFLRGLEKPPKKSDTLNRLKRDASLRGKKNVRKEEWEYYREALDILNNKSRTTLVIIYSYWTTQSIDMPDPTEHIRAVYGVTPELYKLPKIQEYVDTIFKNIILDLDFLKALFDFTFEMFEDHSMFKKWFVDVFSENAKYYLNDWEKYRRKSRKKPDYNRSYKLFIEFILKGKHYKAGDHFVERYRPQGIIRLLYKIHNILYWFKEYEDKMIHKKSIEVKDLFKNIPPYFYRRIIQELYGEEFSTNYHMIIEELYKKGFPILSRITNQQSDPKTLRELILNSAKANAAIHSPSNQKKAIREFIERELKVFSVLLPES